jgi:outer membrane protein assembly factor BamB
VIPKPIYGHGMVFLSTGYDAPSVYAIKVDGSGDVTDTHVAWKLRRGAPHTPSLILGGDDLFMVSDAGIATCVDAKTGMQHWQERIGGNYSASPVLADGKVYFQSEQGVGTVIKADRKFEALAKNDLKEPTLASYGVADGALFLRTEKHLYRFEAK